MQKQRSYSMLSRSLLFYISTTLIFVAVSALVQVAQIRHASAIVIGTAAALTFITLIFFCHRDKITLRQTGVYFHKQSIPRFLRGFMAGMLMILIWVTLVVLLTPFRLSVSAAPGIKAACAALLLYLLVAAREALVFRSYFLTRVRTAFSSTVALLIVTGVFILEHRLAGMSWKMSVIGSGTGGLLFGYAAIKTKGIALPMGLHSAWNFGRWMFGLTGGTGIWHYSYVKTFASRGEAIALTTQALIFLPQLPVSTFPGSQQKTKFHIQSLRPLNNRP